MDDKQLQNISVEYGKKIGFLLEQIDIPNEIKLALADIIPNLEPEQIDKVAEALENTLITQLAIENTTEYKEAEEKINKETISEINNIINN